MSGRSTDGLHKRKTPSSGSMQQCSKTQIAKKREQAKKRRVDKAKETQQKGRNNPNNGTPIQEAKTFSKNANHGRNWVLNNQQLNNMGLKKADVLMVRWAEKDNRWLSNMSSTLAGFEMNGANIKSAEVLYHMIKLAAAFGRNPFGEGDWCKDFVSTFKDGSTWKEPFAAKQAGTNRWLIRRLVKGNKLMEKQLRDTWGTERQFWVAWDGRGIAETCDALRGLAMCASVYAKFIQKGTLRDSIRQCRGKKIIHVSSTDTYFAVTSVSSKGVVTGANRLGRILEWMVDLTNATHSEQKSMQAHTHVVELGGKTRNWKEHWQALLPAGKKRVYAVGAESTLVQRPRSAAKTIGGKNKRVAGSSAASVDGGMISATPGLARSKSDAECVQLLDDTEGATPPSVGQLAGGEMESGKAVAAAGHTAGTPRASAMSSIDCIAKVNHVENETDRMAGKKMMEIADEVDANEVQWELACLVMWPIEWHCNVTKLHQPGAGVLFMTEEGNWAMKSGAVNAWGDIADKAVEEWAKRDGHVCLSPASTKRPFGIMDENGVYEFASVVDYVVQSPVTERLHGQEGPATHGSRIFMVDVVRLLMQGMLTQASKYPKFKKALTDSHPKKLINADQATNARLGIGKSGCVGTAMEIARCILMLPEKGRRENTSMDSRLSPVPRWVNRYTGLEYLRARVHVTQKLLKDNTGKQMSYRVASERAVEMLARMDRKVAQDWVVRIKREAILHAANAVSNVAPQT